jgi:hypothetical protein
MKWLVLGLALGACTEHGQSPSSANIRVGRLDCTLDTASFQLVAEIDATLEVGQAIRATFLSDVDVQLSRFTEWDCKDWRERAGFMGCSRDDEASNASDTVTVTEFNDAQSALSSFSYRAVVTLSDVLGADIETVLVDAQCP